MGKSWKPGGVSAVLIVKNEEALIRRCLESVKDADEIVVLDTGSTDKTVAIAKEYSRKVVVTDPIVPFHFAVARNRADKLATKDWILTIDADEVLEPGGMELIKDSIRLVRDLPKAVHAFRVNFAFPGDDSKDVAVVPKKKLYRRGAFTWQYRVHEQLVPNDPESRTLDQLEIRMTHLPAKDKDGRRTQNRELLEMSVNESPEYRRNFRQLGMEYFLSEDWPSAETWLSKYVASVSKHDDLLDVSETLMRLAQVKDKLGRKDEALVDFDRAILVAPKRREPRYFKAISLIAACRLDDALEVLEGCLEIPASEAPAYHLNQEACWTGTLVQEAIEFCETEIKTAKEKAAAQT